MLSFIVVVGGVVIINNILSNFWKPVTIFSKESWFVNPPYEVKQEHKKD
jgi:hypothetical protein